MEQIIKKHVKIDDIGHFKPSGALGQIDREWEERIPVPQPVQPPPQPPAEPPQPVEAFNIWTPKDSMATYIPKKSPAVVALMERVDINLSHSGKVLSNKCMGRISVFNYGTKDRLWDLSVKLMNMDLTNIPYPEFEKIELSPQKSAFFDYTINKSPDNIVVREFINTLKPTDLDTGDEVPFLSIDGKGDVYFTIVVGNRGTSPVRNVRLHKVFPEPFMAPEIVEVSDGKPEVSVGEAVWTIPNIPPGQGMYLVLRVRANIKDLTPIDTGEINLIGSTSGVISDLDMEEYQALSRNDYFVVVEEFEEVGKWKCQVRFTNTSEFPVKITAILVKDPKTKQTYLEKDNIDIEIQPEDTWESDEWIISSKERPSFINSIDFKIIPEVIKNTKTTIHLEPMKLPILALSMEKDVSPRTIKGNTKTRLTADVNVLNMGSGPLGEVIVLEEIPAPVMPPGREDIIVFCNNQKVDPSGFNVELRPEDRDESKDHILRITIDKFAQDGDRFQPGSVLHITYPMIAINPKPHRAFRFSTEGTGLGPLGKIRISSKVSVSEVPEVHTIPSLRKYSFGKNIEPGSGPGEYRVKLRIKNFGETKLLNTRIMDLVPSGFIVSNASPEPEIHDHLSFMRLIWDIGDLDLGGDAMVVYTITGNGKFDPGEAQVLYDEQ